MAVRRFNTPSFNSAFITFAVGALAGVNQGPFTYLALVRVAADGFFRPILSAEDGTSARRSMWLTSADLLMVNTGGGSNFTGTIALTPGDGWALVGVSKATAGDTATRLHIAAPGAGFTTWTHQQISSPGSTMPDDGSTITNFKIGSWQTGEFWNGEVAAAAVWNGLGLADGAFDGFEAGAASVLDAAPDAFWLLNQESTSDPVLDVTGNGADQTAIAGTSVLTGSDPDWNFNLGGITVAVGAAAATDVAAPITVSKRATLSAAVDAEAARAVTANKNIALVSAGVADTARPLAAVRAFTLVPAREGNAGNALVAAKAVALPAAFERDTAGPLAGSNTVVLDAAVEANPATPVAAVKTSALVSAAESDAAIAVTSTKTVALVAARCTEAARAPTVVRLHLIAPAGTVNDARALAVGKAVTIAAAVEVDRALAVTGPALLVIPGLLTASTTRPRLTAGTTRPLLVARMSVGIPAAPPLINALLNPSLFGWPDAINTGVPASANLTDSGPLVVTTPGAVIEDLEIDGTGVGLAIEVRAPNVVIRRVRVIGRPQPGGGCIKQTNGATGMYVGFSELLYDEPGSGDAVVGDGNWLMEWCDIHHVAEGPRLGTNTTFRWNYVHDLVIDNPGAHADGIQSTGGSNVIVHRNTIRPNTAGAEPANSAAIIGAEFALSNNIQLTENLLDYGGFTLFIGPSESFGMSNVVVRGNRFGPHATFGPVSMEPGIVGLTWENNRMDATNLLVSQPG